MISQLDKSVRPMLATSCGVSPDDLETALAEAHANEAAELKREIEATRSLDAEFAAAGPHWVLAWLGTNGALVGIECDGALFEAVEPEDALGFTDNPPYGRKPGGWIWSGLARDHGLGGLDTRGVWRQATAEEMANLAGRDPVAPADHGARAVDLARALDLDESWASDWEGLLSRVKLEKHNGDKVADLGSWISAHVKDCAVGEHAADAAIRLLTSSELLRPPAVAAGRAGDHEHPTTGAFSLFDGTLFNPYANPVSPVGLTLENLARGLEGTNRFRCQTRRKISVAEHLVRQMRLAALLLGRDGAACSPLTLPWDDSREIARVLLLAILDDAHEGVTPWGDVPTPAKTPWMKAVEGRIDVAIRKSLKISSWAEGDDIIVVTSGPYAAGKGRVSARTLVKLADELALYIEALLWGPANSPDWVGGCVSSWAGVPPLEKLLTVAEPREGDDWLSLTQALLAASR